MSQNPFANAWDSFSGASEHMTHDPPKLVEAWTVPAHVRTVPEGYTRFVFQYKTSRYASITHDLNLAVDFKFMDEDILVAQIHPTKEEPSITPRNDINLGSRSCWGFTSTHRVGQDNSKYTVSSNSVLGMLKACEMVSGLPNKRWWDAKVQVVNECPYRIEYSTLGTFSTVPALNETPVDSMLFEHMMYGPISFEVEEAADFPDLLESARSGKLIVNEPESAFTEKGETRYLAHDETAAPEDMPLSPLSSVTIDTEALAILDTLVGRVPTIYLYGDTAGVFYRVRRAHHPSIVELGPNEEYPSLNPSYNTTKSAVIYLGSGGDKPTPFTNKWLKASNERFMCHKITIVRTTFGDAFKWNNKVRCYVVESASAETAPMWVSDFAFPLRLIEHEGEAVVTPQEYCKARGGVDRGTVKDKLYTTAVIANLAATPGEHIQGRDKIYDLAWTVPKLYLGEAQVDDIARRFHTLAEFCQPTNGIIAQHCAPENAAILKVFHLTKSSVNTRHPFQEAYRCMPLDTLTALLDDDVFIRLLHYVRYAKLFADRPLHTWELQCRVLTAGNLNVRAREAYFKSLASSISFTDVSARAADKKTVAYSVAQNLLKIHKYRKLDTYAAPWLAELTGAGTIRPAASGSSPATLSEVWESQSVKTQRGRGKGGQRGQHARGRGKGSTEVDEQTVTTTSDTSTTAGEIHSIVAAKR